MNKAVLISRRAEQKCPVHLELVELSRNDSRQLR
jgi:hypothetical protein